MALSVSINLLLNSYTGCVIHHLKHDDEFFGKWGLSVFENRWGKMGRVYYPLLRKGGMIKHSVLKVWNKLSEHRFIHIFEYESKESFENCQKISKKIENELFHGLLVKMSVL